ncbi:MAG: hypothetical protein K1X67_25475 [Fimbriimonadaceae bacterium]|nr:hypothetical protein [Fimbriimonadaceae bacterium]
MNFLLMALTALLLQNQTPSNRLDQIWDAADERLVRQIDVWFKDGDYPRIIQLLQFRNELYPQDYEVATDLGWMLENVEDDEAAVAVYKRFRARNPGEKDAPYPEANYYFMKREFAKVPPLIEPTIAKDPHANSYRILAHSYERMERYAESVRVWESYLKLHPDDGAAKNNLERVKGKLKKSG